MFKTKIGSYYTQFGILLFAFHKISKKSVLSVSYKVIFNGYLKFPLSKIPRGSKISSFLLLPLHSFPVGTQLKGNIHSINTS